MKKIKLIYIVGTGHSGSTLLDLIIGSSPEVFSVGELYFYSVYRNKEQPDKVQRAFICTCKKAFDECSFWRDINQKGDFKIKLRFSKKEVIKVMLYVLLPFLTPKPVNSFDDTQVLLEEIYRKARQVKPRLVYILDSSKSFVRLFYLLQIPDIEVYPILLIRDGRGVINSRLRMGQKVGFFSAILQWVLNSLIAKRLTKHNPRAIHISYNLFCQQPEEYIRMLNQKLNIHISEEAFIEDVAKTEYHNIDGNIIKFKGITEIRCDERWKEELSFFKRFMATVLLYPFNTLWVKRDSLRK